MIDPEINENMIHQPITEIDGKLLEDEEDEVITVDFQSYKRLFYMAGGWPMFILGNIILSA